MAPQPAASSDTASTPVRNRRRRKERYELCQQIGEGAMGKVYRALDVVLGRTVAVKVLKPELASNLRYVMQLKREVKLASRVQGPHVVRVHDYGEVDGQPLIAMDWIDGENLAQLMGREHRVPPAQACGLAAQICQALEAIHAAGIIHRDLKPGNLLIDKQGTVRLADFGLARSTVPGEFSVSSLGEKGGTPRYMAPEQSAGLPADCRADLYSLGLVLLEMLTGTTALETLDPLRTQLLTGESDKRQRTGELLKLATLDRVIRRCLQLDRTERYPNATAVLADLKGAEAVVAAAPPAVPVQQGAKGWAPVRKVILYACGFVALTGAVCGTGVQLARYTTAARQSREASSQQFYLKGVGFMAGAENEAELRKALQAFDQAVEDRPGNLPAQSARVEVLIRLFERNGDTGWLSRAYSELRRAESNGLDSDSIVTLRARLDLDSGHFQNAIGNLMAARGRLGPSEEIDRLLGRAVEASGQPAQALQYYENAVRLGPESWLAHNELGVALLNSSHFSEAHQEFNQVIRLKPEATTGYCNRGLTMLRMGEFDQARQDFEQALERAPSADTYANLGDAYYYSREYATSIPFFEAAIRMNQHSTRFMIGLADALWYSNRLDESREAYSRVASICERISTLRPLSIQESCHKIRCLSRLGDVGGAKSVLEALARKHPPEPEVLYTMTLLALRDRRRMAAHQWISEAIHHGYPSAMAQADPDLAELRPLPR